MSRSSEPRWPGGCLCGGVRYHVDGPLRDVENCHCSRCRRAHGHFAAYTAAPTHAMVLTEHSGLRWYVADGRERGFCCECGASLFWRRTASGQTSIAAGTLDAPTGLRSAMHIFTDSAATITRSPTTCPGIPAAGGNRRPPRRRPAMPRPPRRPRSRVPSRTAGSTPGGLETTGMRLAGCGARCDVPGEQLKAGDDRDHGGRKPAPQPAR